MFGGLLSVTMVLTPKADVFTSEEEHHMHAVIVTFRTREMPQDAFRELADEVAPAFSDIPGLVTKIWLDTPDPDAPGGGGVYLFEHKDDADAYLASDLFRSGVSENPHFADVRTKAVGVLDGPTRITSPGLAPVAA
jgi:hypothetical protein